MKYIVLCLAMVSVLLASGCTSQQTNTTTTESQIANPASVFCEQQGGTVDIRDDGSGGQIGICILQNGTEVEEWEYYRSMNP